MTRDLSRLRVGLIAPAGPPLDPDRLSAGIASLESRGIRLIRPRPEIPTTGYLAGHDKDRLAELHELMSDPEIDVIFCVRGGYGTLRLLDGIDYHLAARRPRVLVGYSDITALQLALCRKAGWTGLSGPMVGVEWHRPEPAWEQPLWELLSGDSGVTLSAADGTKPTVLVPGEAEGNLLGGNLAMLTRLIGTPYLPDMAGAILFLEDVGEQPYRIDGMLAHLRLAGILDRLGGVVMGAFTDAAVPPDRPSFTVEQVLEHYFGDAPYPVVSGWNYGHFPVKVTMPIGVRVRLDCSPTDAELVTVQGIYGLS